jgi:rubrerythrin
MREPQKRLSEPVSPDRVAQPAKADPGTTRDDRRAGQKEDAVVCERCGAAMFRMHAVWRCPNCRFKTDCCGW